jgi:hypothetical protein
MGMPSGCPPGGRLHRGNGCQEMLSMPPKKRVWRRSDRARTWSLARVQCHGVRHSEGFGAVQGFVRLLSLRPCEGRNSVSRDSLSYRRERPPCESHAVEENDGAPAPAISSGYPVLLRTSSNAGHGFGTALDEYIDEEADVSSFLFDQLGIRYAPGEESMPMAKP